MTAAVTVPGGGGGGRIWQLTLLTTTVGLAHVQPTTATTASVPPHIIFLLVDDLGHNDVGWKNPLIRTPTLTALAEDGIQLTHHCA